MLPRSASRAWGAVATLVPLINQMNPSADVLALASIDVDLSAINEGQAVKTIFRKQPLFIRHLTAKEIAEADAVPLSELRDPQTLEQRTKEGHKQWLITNGRLHASRLRPAGCPARVKIAGRSAATSALATDRHTIRQHAFAKARLRRISRCRFMPSNQTPSSRSGEVG